MKALIRAIMVLSLASCTSLKDYSEDDRFSDFVGACYQLNEDSYIYSLNHCLDDSGSCFVIQSFGTSEGDEMLPNSKAEFEVQSDRWLKNIKRLARVGGRETIKLGGFAPRGSKFSVQKILNGEQGTLGKFWFVAIQFEGESLNGKSVFVPTPYKYLSPSWVENSRPEQGPVWNRKFVSKCN